MAVEGQVGRSTCARLSLSFSCSLLTLAVGPSTRSISLLCATVLGIEQCPRDGCSCGFLLRPSTPVANSERVLNRHVVEVAVLVLARLVDELPGEEVAVARIALKVTGEVVGCEKVGLGADIASGRGGPGPQHATTLVVKRVLIRRPPEEVLLERKRQPLDRADDDSPVGADDVLSPDVVDVPQVRVAVRVELIERLDVPSSPVVTARVIELEVDAGRQPLDRQGVAENGREHRSRDVAAANWPELRRPLHLEVQAGGADLAPHAAAEGMSPPVPRGAVEGGALVVGVQPVEVQIHGQDVKRPGAEYAEELQVRG